MQRLELQLVTLPRQPGLEVDARVDVARYGGGRQVGEPQLARVRGEAVLEDVAHHAQHDDQPCRDTALPQAAHEGGRVHVAERHHRVLARRHLLLLGRERVHVEGATRGRAWHQVLRRQPQQVRGEFGAAARAVAREVVDGRRVLAEALLDQLHLQRVGVGDVLVHRGRLLEASAARRRRVLARPVVGVAALLGRRRRRVEQEHRRGCHEAPAAARAGGLAVGAVLPERRLASPLDLLELLLFALHQHGRLLAPQPLVRRAVRVGVARAVLLHNVVHLPPELVGLLERVVHAPLRGPEHPLQPLHLLAHLGVMAAQFRVVPGQVLRHRDVPRCRRAAARPAEGRLEGKNPGPLALEAVRRGVARAEAQLVVLEQVLRLLELGPAPGVLGLALRLGEVGLEGVPLPRAEAVDAEQRGDLQQAPLRVEHAVLVVERQPLGVGRVRGVHRGARHALALELPHAAGDLAHVERPAAPRLAPAARDVAHVGARRRDILDGRVVRVERVDALGEEVPAPPLDDKVLRPVDARRAHLRAAARVRLLRVEVAAEPRGVAVGAARRLRVVEPRAHHLEHLDLLVLARARHDLGRVVEGVLLVQVPQPLHAVGVVEADGRAGVPLGENARRLAQPPAVRPVRVLVGHVDPTDAPLAIVLVVVRHPFGEEAPVAPEPDRAGGEAEAAAVARVVLGQECLAAEAGGGVVAVARGADFRVVVEQVHEPLGARARLGEEDRLVREGARQVRARARWGR